MRHLTCSACNVGKEVPGEAWKSDDCGSLNDLSGKAKEGLTSDLAGAIGGVLVAVVVFLMLRSGAEQLAASPSSGRAIAVVVALVLGATVYVGAASEGRLLPGAIQHRGLGRQLGRGTSIQADMRTLRRMPSAGRAALQSHPSNHRSRRLQNPRPRLP